MDLIKQLFVLECREELLNNILKFKRGALEDGYVRQEVKRAEREKEAEKQRLAAEQKDDNLSGMDEQELAAMRAAGGSKDTSSNQEE